MMQVNIKTVALHSDTLTLDSSFEVAVVDKKVTISATISSDRGSADVCFTIPMEQVVKCGSIPDYVETVYKHMDDIVRY